MRRGRLRGAAVAAFLGLAGMAGGPAPLRAQPLVPFCASFSHWDHHWFIWLPRDPDYEAIEIHSQDARDGAKPLVWVYFTERKPPKRQVNFVNDEALARLRGWIFRDVAYELRNRVRAPRGVALRFADHRNRSVAVTFDVKDDAVFATAGAGVTNQMGHGADGVFLLLHRQATAEASASAVLIEAADVSEQLPGGKNPLPFHAAYSPNSFNAAILFRECAVSFGEAAAEPPGALKFAQAPATDAGGRRFVARRGELEFELVTDASGATERYTLRRGGHVFTASFAPPLPAAAAIRSSFSLSLDDLKDLVGGQVDVGPSAAGHRLDWRPDYPAWARQYPFQTRLRPSGSGYAVDGRTLRGSQQ
jgi:hypothetical protein